MKFEQKRLSNEIRFDLQQKYLEYFIKDKSSKGTHKIAYESITNDVTEFYEKNFFLKNVSIYALIIGILFTLGNVFLHLRTASGLFLIGSVIFFIVYKTTQVTYSILDCTDKKIYIIKDKQHDRILDAIFNSRNTYLKSTYGFIDHNNDPENEIRKFSWLKSIGAIGNNEYQTLISNFDNRDNSLLQ